MNQSRALAFDPVNRAWLMQAGGSSDVDVPALDGALSVDAISLEQAADDFGHLLHRWPIAVLEPGSEQDVMRMVNFARRHKLNIGARGYGYSVYGQSQVEGGIVVQMRALDRPPVFVFGPDRVEVSTGLSWADLLAATLKRGLRPPVVTNDLELSVGGTLSFGGLDGGSFRHGAQVDNVLELQVVTGEGRRETCSETQLPELFNAALAGQGQCGIIVRVTLRLIPAHTHARVYELLYPDLHTMLADERRLVADGKIDRVSGCIRPSASGNWYYYLQAERYFTPPDGPGLEILPEAMQYRHGFEKIYTLPYYDCVVRNPRFRAIRASGEVRLPHPWLNEFLPDSTIDQFLAETFMALTPADIGIDFPVTFWIIKKAVCKRPLLSLPEESSGFLFHLMGTLPDQAKAEAMIDRFIKFDGRAKELGGKQYPINSLPMTRQDWKEHYGPFWGKFLEAKRRFDPDDILTPGPGIF